MVRFSRMAGRNHHGLRVATDTLLSWRILSVRAARFYSGASETRATTEVTQMAYTTEQQHPIVPRERLDFGLDRDDIPKYWFGGDAFKTRFFDAMSIIFPPGERFFMTTVRDFRDRITDPRLLQDIKDFNRQEAQHSMVHAQYNDRLRAQGMPVDALTKWLEKLLFDTYRSRYSREYTLGITGALEHFRHRRAPHVRRARHHARCPPQCTGHVCLARH